MGKNISVDDILKEPVEIRLAKAKKGDTAPELLGMLTEDSFWFVRDFVAKNPNTPEASLYVLSKDFDHRVRYEANKNLTARGLNKEDPSGNNPGTNEEERFMKNLNMESAIKRYNSIMMEVCYEHSTIGTNFSENTENWNLRDMVAEADYLLSCYHEAGHCRCEDRFLGPDEYKLWLSETGKLDRFIKAYEPFVKDMVCFQGHCSKFDNEKGKGESIDSIIKKAKAELENQDNSFKRVSKELEIG